MNCMLYFYTGIQNIKDVEAAVASYQKRTKHTRSEDGGLHNNTGAWGMEPVHGTPSDDNDPEDESEETDFGDLLQVLLHLLLLL